MQQIAALHFVGVLFEAGLPVVARETVSTGKKIEYAANLGVGGNFPQPDVGDVGERHHHRHAAVGQSEEIESFELGSERACADVLYGSDALVWINDLFTDLEGHAKSPWLKPAFICTSNSANVKQNHKLNRF